MKLFLFKPDHHIHEIDIIEDETTTITATKEIPNGLRLLIFTLSFEYDNTTKLGWIFRITQYPFNETITNKPTEYGKFLTIGNAIERMLSLGFKVYTNNIQITI